MKKTDSIIQTFATQLNNVVYNFYLISDLKKTNLTYILKKNILNYK